MARELGTGRQSTDATRKRPYSSPPLRRRLYRMLMRLPMPQALSRRIYRHGTLRIKIDASHSFLMHSSGDYIENDLHRWGYGNGWEGVSLLAWSRLVPQAGTIIDIGALHGVYALAAKCLNPQARVIAFEPVESSYQRVVENADVNGFDIGAERAAVSDRTGSAVIFDSPKWGHARSSLERPPPAQYVEIDVQTFSLDDYMQQKKVASVDLIKIDIEGHEAAAVRGMSELIARSKPTILIEVLTDDAGTALLGMLEPHGYRLFRISDTDGLDPVVHIDTGQRGSRNFLFCQPDVFEAAGLADLLIDR